MKVVSYDKAIEAIKEVIKMAETYKKGYEILSEYFDSISEDERQSVHERLNEVGL